MPLYAVSLRSPADPAGLLPHDHAPSLTAARSAVSAAAELSVALGQYSAAGNKTVNQDALGARHPSGSELDLKGVALAVADGISSSQVSEVAAETSVLSFISDYYATPDAWSVKTAASRVIAATNSWLHSQNRHAQTSNPDRGLVCTLSALVIKGREAHLFHVGDSRISRLTGNGLEPLTEDHVTVLSSEEQYLGRALGIQPRVEIDYTRVSLQDGDVFLLTTDGVHDFIDADTVSSALADADLAGAARTLAEAALARGSDDNVTVQLARIDALPAGASPAFDELEALPIPAPPRAGEHIDGFEILRTLNSTHRSHIYLARGAGGERVALKLPATETRDDAAQLRRFALEEWVARRIASAHVVKAAAAPAQRSAFYVVTEYVEGCTLRQWMADNPGPDLDSVREIAEQIARGLRALHRREIVHQDLRPENIMIDRNGTVKLIDLASASVAGIEESAPGTAGALPGTLQYTAPEYLSGDIISWRADQFSLGVIVYEMLTGRLPYGTQVAQVRSARDQRSLRYRPARGEDCPAPEWIDFALTRATHPDPLRRYDALSEFTADLRRPAAGYQPMRQRPLLERNPVRFWQSVAGGLAVIILLLLLRAGS